MRKKEVWDVLRASTRLGLTSFGGPLAHVGYFREEYVNRRKWIDDKSYADLVALCQFLPGPVSSQMGIGIGLSRAGLPGALAAWIGFTLPSALVLMFFAVLFRAYNLSDVGWVHGLKLAAVVVVMKAVWGMGKTLAPDRKRMFLAIGAAVVVLLWESAFAQVAVIAGAGSAGLLLYRNEAVPLGQMQPVRINKATACGSLGLFVLLLMMLPFAASWTGSDWVRMFSGFYRAGALVFGGGHVVLPLLERVVVPEGWVTREEFLAGYAIAQAIPGPLFTFASYLGMTAKGWAGAMVATSAIFLPAFLLVVGVLPVWNVLRTQPRVQGVLKGVNAAVVGILLAALYQPVWTGAVKEPGDLAFVLILFGLLAPGKLPPWAVVGAAAIGGWMLTVFST